MLLTECQTVFIAASDKFHFERIPLVRLALSFGSIDTPKSTGWSITCFNNERPKIKRLRIEQFVCNTCKINIVIMRKVFVLDSNNLLRVNEKTTNEIEKKTPAATTQTHGRLYIFRTLKPFFRPANYSDDIILVYSTVFIILSFDLLRED